MKAPVSRVLPQLRVYTRSRIFSLFFWNAVLLWPKQSDFGELERVIIRGTANFRRWEQEQSRKETVEGGVRKSKEKLSKLHILVVEISSLTTKRGKSLYLTNRYSKEPPVREKVLTTPLRTTSTVLPTI